MSQTWKKTYNDTPLVYPASTEEVSEVLKICHVKRIPVTSYSSETSLERHYTPTYGGISVKFSRMDKVLAVHHQDIDVVVQPAVQWQKLNEDLKNDNLFFPPDPGPGAMIGGMLAAIELLDDNQMEYLNHFVGESGVKRNKAPTLFLKFGGTPDAVREQVKIVEKLASKAGSLSFDFARDKKQEANLWSSRRDALWATMSVMKEGDKVLTSDVAVPISRLPDAIEQAKAHITALGLVGSIVGHAGDSNFHTIAVYSKEQRAQAEDFLHAMVDRALEMEGTCTGEHGVGLGKRDAVVKELGEDTVAAMRRIKLVFDPLCLLNCDKIFKSQKDNI
ncbi:d-lactate dehydrogenase [Fusarium subglutinans]|uniref:D-lactate dehydrogenase (cytochrome) n=1 Tax=Gibberella subglutinans TaxID=42677 RepID=A0A8H5P8J8_GIBSU|nr:d-lactate dehydrogenase [Fusarium subglutinans]KAF5592018.1 d-lactate dehydrogenase [Fusarium subglutinans]